MKKHTSYILCTLRRLWLAAALFALVGTARGQVVAEAKLDTAGILIGQQVQLTVSCAVNANQKVTFPYYTEQQELTKGVEVVSCGPVDTIRLNDGKRLKLVRKYTITSFDSAVYSIPPLMLSVDGDSVATRGTVGLKVSTVQVDLQHPDKYNGPHDVVEQPFTWSWELLLVSLGCILLLVLAVVLRVRLTDPRLITRRVVVHPPTPAHVTALQQIDRIKGSGTPDVKQLYMELTETLRTYIEQRFGFSAKEMTTQEIIDRLCQTNNEEALGELRNVLVTADLVKFAKHSTTASEQDRSLVDALSYVQTTKVQPAELPKPHVEYVSLSTKQQIRWRNVMRVAVWALSLGALALWAYCLYLIYCSFA